MNGSAKEQGLWFRYTLEPNVHNRNLLIEWYSGFVQHLANQTAARIPSNLIDSDDLFSVGVIALIGCIDRFDPGRGLKFTTIAGTRIRGAFQDHLRQIDWMSRNARPKAQAIRKAIARLGMEDAIDFEILAIETGFTSAECEVLIENQSDWLKRGVSPSVMELSQ